MNSADSNTASTAPDNSGRDGFPPVDDTPSFDLVWGAAQSEHRTRQRWKFTGLAIAASVGIAFIIGTDRGGAPRPGLADTLGSISLAPLEESFGNWTSPSDRWFADPVVTPIF